MKARIVSHDWGAGAGEESCEVVAGKLTLTVLVETENGTETAERAFDVFDLEAVELTGHPEPIRQGPAEPPKLVAKEFDMSLWGSDGRGGRVRVGEKRTVVVHVPEPPAKPKTKAKGAS
jgi:hypothetical protein